MERVRKFTYVGGRVSGGGGCEAAVTTRTRCELVVLRESGELLYDRLPLKLKGAVHKSYARPATQNCMDAKHGT